MRALVPKLGIVLVVVFAARFAQAAASNKSLVRGVGAGINYPALTQSLLVNPAGMTEGARFNLAGLYRFDSQLASGHLNFNTGTFGLGAGYIQEGTTTNTYQGGIGFRLRALRIGAEVHSDGSSFDGDVGAIVHLSNLRVGVVARDVSTGVSRVDSGLGFRIGQAMIGLDLKYPMQGDEIFFDASFAYVAANFTLGVGYDTGFNRVTKEISGGGPHAGVSVGLQGRLFLEAFYRPLAQEWATSDFTAGLRLMF